MRHKLKLTPNPFKYNRIARVVVVFSGNKDSVVVDVDRIYRDSYFFKPLNQGYYVTVVFLQILGIIEMVLIVLASIMWHWWLIFVGIIIMQILTTYSRQKVAGFILASLENDTKNIGYYFQHHLAWTTPNTRLACG